MASKEPLTKKRRLDFTENINIVVGTGTTKQTYTVHKNFLRTSEFFQKACKSQWKEGQTKTIKLPEAQPTEFETYLQIRYTGDMVTEEEEVAIESGGKADMVLDKQSKNAIVDHLFEKIEEYGVYLGCTIAHLILDNTTGSCPLRRFIVDFAVVYLDHEYDDDDPPKPEYLMGNPPQLLVDLSLKLTRLRKENKPPTDPCKAAKCTYHEHDDANPKCT